MSNTCRYMQLSNLLYMGAAMQRCIHIDSHTIHVHSTSLELMSLFFCLRILPDLWKLEWVNSGSYMKFTINSYAALQFELSNYCYGKNALLEGLDIAPWFQWFHNPV